MRYVLLLVLFDLAVPAAAQSTFIVALPSSPARMALGNTALGEAPDPYAFVYNPAFLGRFGREARAAVGSFPGATDWLGLGELDYYNGAVSAGLDLSPHGLPVYAGVGLAHSRLTDEQELRDENNEPLGTQDFTDAYTTLGLGVGLKHPVQVSFGLNVRYGGFDYTDYMASGELEVHDANSTTFDLGVLVNVPVHALAGGFEAGETSFTLDVALGYAQSGIGPVFSIDHGNDIGSVTYSPVRMARLGHMVTLGVEAPVGATTMRAVSAGVIAEAEHGLARPALDEDGRCCVSDEYSHAAVLGEINVLRHALLGGGNDAVTGHRALRLTFFETFELRRGWFEGGGFGESKAQGYVVRADGLLRLLGALAESPALLDAGRRVGVALTRTTYFVDAWAETSVTGLTLTLFPR